MVPASLAEMTAATIAASGLLSFFSFAAAAATGAETAADADANKP